MDLVFSVHIGWNLLWWVLGIIHFIPLLCCVPFLYSEATAAFKYGAVRGVKGFLDALWFVILMSCPILNWCIVISFARGAH